MVLVISTWLESLAKKLHRFLLKYASRDEVAVLSRGNGGIVEMRNNIAQFEENSPLFGFLRYRRRNVIIKYLPEGTSRLIQGSYDGPSPSLLQGSRLMVFLQLE